MNFKQIIFRCILNIKCLKVDSMKGSVHPVKYIYILILSRYQLVKSPISLLYISWVFQWRKLTIKFKTQQRHWRESCCLLCFFMMSDKQENLHCLVVQAVQFLQVGGAGNSGTASSLPEFNQQFFHEFQEDQASEVPEELFCPQHPI